MARGGRLALTVIEKRIDIPLFKRKERNDKDKVRLKEDAVRKETTKSSPPLTPL